MPTPSNTTLRKYGLSMEEWQKMWTDQEGKCPICLKSMTRPVVDHFHVKGWKNLPPEQRKCYVRGLLCWLDNAKLLTRGITSEKLRRAADYLDKWKLPP